MGDSLGFENCFSGPALPAWAAVPEDAAAAGLPMPNESLSPRITLRQCGGWLAVSNAADPVKIGVTAASELDASLEFGKVRARWQAILESDADGARLTGAPPEAR